MKTAITPTRSEDFSQWYQNLITAADLAENAPVRGCMTVKPYGWAIWELMRDEMDKRIKACGVPLRVEIGAREMESGTVTITRRDLGRESKRTITTDELIAGASDILATIQNDMLNAARARILYRINFTFANGYCRDDGD